MIHCHHQPKMRNIWASKTMCNVSLGLAFLVPPSKRRQYEKSSDAILKDCCCCLVVTRSNFNFLPQMAYKIRRRKLLNVKHTSSRSKMICSRMTQKGSFIGMTQNGFFWPRINSHTSARSKTIGLETFFQAQNDLKWLPFHRVTQKGWFNLEPRVYILDLADVW